AGCNAPLKRTHSRDSQLTRMVQNRPSPHSVMERGVCLPKFLNLWSILLILEKLIRAALWRIRKDEKSLAPRLDVYASLCVRRGGNGDSSSCIGCIGQAGEEAANCGGLTPSVYSFTAMSQGAHRKLGPFSVLTALEA